MVKTPFQQVSEFHEQFGFPIRWEPTFLPPEELELRKTLITEEYKEVIEALDSGNLEESVKELMDLLYVVYGTCVQMGIDETAAFNEVHRSNMSKLWNCDACKGNGVVDENGNPYSWGHIDSYDCCICDGYGHYVNRRDDGKILKPETYSPANIKSILER